MASYSFMHLTMTYTVLITTALLVFVAISHILYQKRSAHSMISWLLAVVLLPYLAIPLYFFIGIRKRSSGRHKETVTFGERSHPDNVDPLQSTLLKVLEKNGIPPATSGNDYQLITSGTEAFVLMLEEIQAAKESIQFCTYVFAHDEMTEVMLAALTQRAREGIQVSLLLDIAGSFRAYVNQKPFAALKKAGGHVLFFAPLFRKPFQSYITLRNHRKIYLFDRQTVLGGGMNLSNAYMGADDGTQRWQDILYRLEGPAVYHFYVLFINDWNYAAGKKEQILPRPSKRGKGESVVQFIPSGPDIPSDALYEALLSSMYEARERIWIVTPYFVPDDTMMQALVIAKHRGVDVKLITPRESDHLIADLGRNPYMKELYEAEVDIVLYEGDMLHAKSILFDSTSSMIGSVNFDNRSLFLNYEVVTFAYSTHLIVQVEAWMKGLIAHSGREMKQLSKSREALGNIMKVFTPLL